MSAISAMSSGESYVSIIQAGGCPASDKPGTWLPVTHADDDHRAASYLGAVWQKGLATPDVNELRLLGHTPRHVGTLGQATGGQPWRSPRYQTTFRSTGIEHELPAALMADGTVWGYLVLLRPPELPDFSVAEAAFVAAVGPHLAEAQRIFDKAGVRSRRDLVAEVFYRHHPA